MRRGGQPSERNNKTRERNHTTSCTLGEASHIAGEALCEEGVQPSERNNKTRERNRTTSPYYMPTALSGASWEPRGSAFAHRA